MVKLHYFVTQESFVFEWFLAPGSISIYIRLRFLKSTKILWLGLQVTYLENGPLKYGDNGLVLYAIFLNPQSISTCFSTIPAVIHKSLIHYSSLTNAMTC